MHQVVELTKTCLDDPLIEPSVRRLACLLHGAADSSDSCGSAVRRLNKHHVVGCVGCVNNAVGGKKIKEQSNCFHFWVLQHVQ